MPDFMIGYGEDSLTLWALTTQMKAIVPDGNDEHCLIFYRPSFGRGENFGEFDAMIVTHGCVYLIESKWHRSKEYKKRSGRIVFSKSQLNRHETVENWLISSGSHPATNHLRHLPDGRPLGPSTTLSNNMLHIWNSIKGILGPSKEVKHICLFFSPIDQNLSTPSVDLSVSSRFMAPFRVVHLPYAAEDILGGFIRLSISPQSPFSDRSS